jgi:parvulin-like peptidyl-prolyl isomerase
MAIIGKIRERGLLIATVVFVSLGLFVLGDLWSNNGGRMRGDEAIAEIAGVEIPAMEFQRRCDEQADLYRANGTTVDNQMQEQIRNSVWNELLRELTLRKEAEEAGFGTSLSKEEFDDIRWGENVISDFKNNENFKDPKTGQVDKALLKRYFASVQERDPALYDYQKRTFIPNRIYAKYNALLKKSCFVNSSQLRDDFAAKNTKATFNFVAKRYDSEPDSLYPVGNDDLVAYFNSHRSEKKWKQSDARRFVYVRFSATPTQEDINAVRDELSALRPEFEAAKGQADSLFVLRHANTKNGTAQPYTGGTADVFNDSLITNADTGTVVGPYREGELWKLVKVKELADVPEARVRHILFNTQGKSTEDTDRLKARADSVLAVVKRDRKKFPELVKKFSEDPGSSQKEGDEAGVYDWFDKKRMVPEFTAASFDEKVGAITICKTSYGFHIVEVLGQRSRKERRVLTVDARVRPDRAMKDAWKNASAFALENTDTASFRTAALEKGLPYTPVDELRADARYVPGLQDASAVVSWVNHAKLGDKPSEPLAADESYVVALLTGIREEGEPRLEDVREAMTREVIKEKKAAAMVEKMTGKTDLNTLAQELGVTVQTASDMAFNSYSIPGGFSDGEVIGRIFTLQSGQTSTPLKGDMATYMVSMTTLTPAGEMPAGVEDAKAAADRVRNRAEYQAFNALKEMAEVKDERSKFY